MVTSRRSFEGTLPLTRMRRLCELLASTRGDVHYTLDFGTDELGTDIVELSARCAPEVICQRSLEPFSLPLEVNASLGLLRSESGEAALPPEVEPLLVPDDGRLDPVAVIEDELLLAMPLVPINPDSSVPDHETGHDPDESDGSGPSENPFAVLRGLKQ